MVMCLSCLANILRVFSPAGEEKSDGMRSAIHLSFTDVFRLLDLDKRTKILDGYLADLRKSIDTEMKDCERHGMLMVL